MDVIFSRDPSGSSLARFQRADGVTLQMRGYDRKLPVPHDLAHLVAEREFRYTRGVWGSLAAGAVFGSVEVVSGRPRHDWRRRSEAVLAAHSRDLALAELIAGVVHHGLDQTPAQVERGLASAWGMMRTGSAPYPAEVAHRAVDTLRHLGEQWRALPPDGELTVEWPYPPVSVPVTKPRRH